MHKLASTAASIVLLATVMLAQQAYQPKFPGDPARSDKEAAALGYMRVVLNAEKTYKQRHGGYATSLEQLVGQGSFTRRMVATTRGEYKVKYKGTPQNFSLWLTPDQPQPDLRAFFTDEKGKITAEETKTAGPTSAPVTAKE
ncbi:MAG TPA: hypothetical protein VMU24_10660 [Candidatus Acidoferrales bacterium]|nr:hypothetical protein [Candidatus Acidoferrales bacterium]